MKYMTFNNSCSYAGLANLLEEFEVDIEDYQLAEEIKSAYIFKYDDELKKYISGSMLQGEIYFNYYLANKGLKFVENKLKKEEVIAYLERSKGRKILALNMDNTSKHGVIYWGMEGKDYIFLNNKRKDSKDLDYFNYNRGQLLSRLSPSTYIGHIERQPNKLAREQGQIEEMEKSLKFLDKYEAEVESFCIRERDVGLLKAAMESYFRVFFIDVYTMMGLVNQKDLMDRIGDLRRAFLRAIKLNASLKLSDYMSMEDFKSVLKDYRSLIARELSNFENLI